MDDGVERWVRERRIQMQHPPYVLEEYEALRKMLRRFVKNEIEPHVEAWEENGAFPRDLLDKLKQLGLLGMSFPEELDGQGGDDFSVIIMAEELGRAGAGGFVLALMCHAELATSVLGFLGTAEQVERYFKPALAGEKLVAYGLSDFPPQANRSPALRAVMDGNGWIVSGTKRLVPLASQAELIVFAARSDDGAKEEKWTLFVAELDRPGIAVEERRQLVGLQSMDVADVAFDRVRLTQENVLGSVGGAFSFMERLWYRECLIRSAICLGMAQCAYDLARTYAKERHVFQRPLSRFQVPAHLLAEMAVEIEAVRQLVYGAAYRFVQGEENGKDAVLARVSSAQTAHWVADRALQLFGGYGYMMEYPIQRVWRDTRWFRMSGGTDEQLKVWMAERMGC